MEGLAYVLAGAALSVERPLRNFIGKQCTIFASWANAGAHNRSEIPMVHVWSRRYRMKLMDEYQEFLANLRKETGLDMLVSDESGLVTISVDGAYNLKKRRDLY